MCIVTVSNILSIHGEAAGSLQTTVGVCMCVSRYRVSHYTRYVITGAVDGAAAHGKKFVCLQTPLRKRVRQHALHAHATATTVSKLTQQRHAVTCKYRAEREALFIHHSVCSSQHTLQDDRAEVPEVFDELDSARLLLGHVLLERLVGRRRRRVVHLDELGERERWVPCARTAVRAGAAGTVCGG